MRSEFRLDFRQFVNCHYLEGKKTTMMMVVVEACDKICSIYVMGKAFLKKKQLQLVHLPLDISSELDAVVQLLILVGLKGRAEEEVHV